MRWNGRNEIFTRLRVRFNREWIADGAAPITNCRRDRGPFHGVFLGRSSRARTARGPRGLGRHCRRNFAGTTSATCGCSTGPASRSRIEKTRRPPGGRSTTHQSHSSSSDPEPDPGLPLRGVVVQRDPQVVHEPDQPGPVLLEADQHFATRGREFRVRQLRLGLSLHRRHSLPHFGVGGRELHAADGMFPPLVLLPIQRTDAPQPRYCPLLRLVPPLADFDEITPDVAQQKTRITCPVFTWAIAL